MTAPKSTKHTLAVPIQHDGREIGEVSLRRPKVKDLRAINAAGKDGDELDQSTVMIATLSGLPPEAVDELDTEDFVALSETVADFFPKVEEPETGEA